MKLILAASVVGALAVTPQADPQATHRQITHRQVADQEWADGVPFTTDWNTAIKEVQSTGKLLLIYNGWERRKV